ncbi:hypothetical protein [Nonomuraea endophytica]|uniref:Uncharacterized protein n=1 Tax=Nonomuraea endophytica TaxID=714136 RepID=A0A7W8EJY3_9ACTN|nr:hypothetical protein [Nonomuraea endophytica]MBB5082031.1 hypothetical protein [Nonomuraea endophytica]
MNELKSMWATVRPGTEEDLAGARRRLMNGMRPRRRFATAPRMLVAAGAAAAVVATPLIVATGTPAYAVTTNPDGTITLAVNELRDPDALEADLRAAGVAADVTFLPTDTWCAETPRFDSVDAAYNGNEVLTRGKEKEWRSFQATRILSLRELKISPEHIRPGETVVLEYSETPAGPAPWRLGTWLAKAGSTVKSCTPVPRPAS